jgi:hypothetical protein
VATDDPTDKKSSTSDYSATKAPENRDHVESEAQSGDPRLHPGGAHAASAGVGMQELDRDSVPSEADRATIVAMEHADSDVTDELP